MGEEVGLVGSVFAERTVDESSTGQRERRDVMISSHPKSPNAGSDPTMEGRSCEKQTNDAQLT